VWEILHSTVIKMSKQVNQLQKMIEDMRDKLKEHERRVKSFLSVAAGLDHVLSCRSNGIVSF